MMLHISFLLVLYYKNKITNCKRNLYFLRYFSPIVSVETDPVLPHALSRFIPPFVPFYATIPALSRHHFNHSDTPIVPFYATIYADLCHHFNHSDTPIAPLYATIYVVLRHHFNHSDTPIAPFYATIYADLCHHLYFFTPPF